MTNSFHRPLLGFLVFGLLAAPAHAQQAPASPGAASPTGAPGAASPAGAQAPAPAAAGAQGPGAPKPADTEVWEPVPKVVAPGAAPGAAPDDAIVLFDGKNLDQWVSVKDKGAAGWTVADGIFTVNKPMGGS